MVELFEPPPVEAPDSGVIDDAKARQRRERVIGALDCHLDPGQAVFHAGSLYLLAGAASSTPLPGYQRVVRVTP